MCKRFYFCACADEFLLKDAEQNVKKKPVFTLVFKLRPWGSFNFNPGGDI